MYGHLTLRQYGGIVAIYRSGNIWSVYQSADLLLIPSSGTLTRDGCLVMETSAARAARDRFPGLARRLGLALLPTPALYCEGSRVHCFALHVGEGKLGVWQTKLYWRDPVSPVLVSAAVQRLSALLSLRPLSAVHLCLPDDAPLDGGAIELRPLLSPLPDEVTVWTPAPGAGLAAPA